MTVAMTRVITSLHYTIDERLCYRVANPEAQGPSKPEQGLKGLRPLDKLEYGCGFEWRVCGFGRKSPCRAVILSQPQRATRLAHTDTTGTST